MLTTFLAYISTLYNLARISFYNWLDLSGIQDTSDPTVKWVYYTHLGRRYRLPVRKSKRGPSQRDEKLGIYFENDRNQESEVRGPLGDYHGMLKQVKQAYGLDLDTIHAPWDNAAEFLFESQNSDISKYVIQFLTNQNFQNSVEQISLDFVKCSRQFYDVLDPELQKIVYERQSQNIMRDSEFEFIEYSKYFEDVNRILEELKGNDDFFKALCEKVGLPLSLGIFLRDYVITLKPNMDLFATAYKDIIAKYSNTFTRDEMKQEQEVHPPDEEIVVVDDYEVDIQSTKIGSDSIRSLDDLPENSFKKL